MSDDAQHRAWPLAIWLLPADDDAGSWQTLVDTLAASHRSPRFEPHLTLHVGTCAGGVDPVPAMQASAAMAPPIVLEASATDHSAVFFRTLFVPFGGPATARADLDDLRARLVYAWRLVEAGADAAARDAAVERTVADDLAAYRLDPHLSLLYARLEAPARAGLARAHDVTGRPVRFDRLAFVRPAPGFTDMVEVDRWQVFGHCRLGEANITDDDDRPERLLDRP